jgi:hypothetical protein
LTNSLAQTAHFLCEKTTETTTSEAARQFIVPGQRIIALGGIFCVGNWVQNFEFFTAFANHSVPKKPERSAKKKHLLGVSVFLGDSHRCFGFN